MVINCVYLWTSVGCPKINQLIKYSFPQSYQFYHQLWVFDGSIWKNWKKIYLLYSSKSFTLNSSISVWPFEVIYRTLEIGLFPNKWFSFCITYSVAISLTLIWSLTPLALVSDHSLVQQYSSWKLKRDFSCYIVLLLSVLQHRCISSAIRLGHWGICAELSYRGQKRWNVISVRPDQTNNLSSTSVPCFTVTGFRCYKENRGQRSRQADYHWRYCFSFHSLYCEKEWKMSNIRGLLYKKGPGKGKIQMCE